MNLSSESYRMRLSLAKGFSNVTRNIENMIRDAGWLPEDQEPNNYGNGNWSGQEIWMSAKIVSQFNFIISLELSLKALLVVTVGPTKSTHTLARLYKSLRKEEKNVLEELFSTHVGSDLVMGRAFQTGTMPESQASVLVNNFHDFCNYCDSEAKFHIGRYAYESVEKRGYIHFIRELDALLVFLDMVERLVIDRWKKRNA